MNIKKNNNLIKYFTIVVLIIFSIIGCSPLLAPTITRNSPIVGYKYVYLTPTSEKTSVTGGTYGYGNGFVFGATKSHSINPTDLICGHFLKRGFTRLPELKQELEEQTIVVNYGETGRRQTGFGSYTIEVTIQILSAQTSEVLCVCTAEGHGETEADDVRIAINRCMNMIFQDGN